MTAAQPTRKPSPLRGLILGLVLAVVLFPSVRHLVFGTIWSVLAVAGGLLVCAIIYPFASARR